MLFITSIELNIYVYIYFIVYTFSLNDQVKWKDSVNSNLYDTNLN